MRALSVLRVSGGTSESLTFRQGYPKSSRELVLLDALTGETFRFSLPLRSSGKEPHDSTPGGQDCSFEGSEVCSWLSLEHHIQHELLPNLPPLTTGEDEQPHQLRGKTTYQRGASCLSEPRRCLCLVEATGRSLAAEAAAARAAQEGSGSNTVYTNSLLRSDGPVGLVLLRSELLMCLQHSISPVLGVAVAHTAADPRQAHAGASSIASEGGSAGIRQEKHPECMCSRRGCFQFPWAKTQQRLASGELKVLRAAALLDGDVSFKSFGSNVVAAACSCCCSGCRESK
ncbi:uncharacterized protein LOC34622743 [Cyclospora cayetanensis]|uniref:Uncharacterized protein LOC34622743 n=1 Tax=Cyclospora cayetanensis TaxID=88456 RepID=A0A6P6S3L4_9EIME|nr:uncharacterized protein LOC34622743 [Cyclospora cayetanensis]